MPTPKPHSSSLLLTLPVGLLLAAGCNVSSPGYDDAFGTGDDDNDGVGSTGTTGTTGETGDMSGTAETGSDDATSSSTTEDSLDSAGDLKFDVLETPDSGGGSSCGGEEENDDATLNGQVFAPNGVIPVAGALVYIANEPPEGIPDHVYCAECVELDCTVDFSETDVEGNFSLPANSGNGKYIVVQKGQFMRVTPIDIAPGPTDLPDAMVELPGEWNPGQGLYIPKIAIADGGYDRIEDALGKFGLGDTVISNYTESTIPGTESFDLYNNGRNPTSDGFISQGDMSTLVNDPNKLNQYHIIFVPCSYDTYSDQLTQQGIQNIRDWVAAGGRWYVADWSNEWMWKVFPEYQNFYGGNDAD
ncbi:MAG: hypothetical protein KC457_06440, partial [Myxococcales bacterium]|nr:hypothetical protein [Myxococcales bacterium]